MKKHLLLLILLVVSIATMVISAPTSAAQNRSITITQYTNEEEALKEYARITGKDINELRKILQRSREEREQQYLKTITPGMEWH